MTTQIGRMRARLRAGKTLTVVRWEFERGQERVACQIERANRGHDADTFAVIERPYQKLQRASVEVFQSATAALRRHAAIASDLRAAGWKVVEYTH